MLRVLLIVAAWIAAVSLASAADPATGIDWEVKHRFRVVADARHDAFIQDFNSYFRRSAERRGLDIPSGQRWFFPSPFEQGFPTHYDPEKAQYRHRWFHDDARVIDVRLTRRADRGKRCLWTLDGRQSAVSTCGRPARLETALGRHDLVVKVLGPGAAEEERRLAIEVKDLKFVTLGDSFASGEGNPHVTFSENNPRRLAEWWDHRCHRSLLSASAQTAIMMAQQRRDTSITYVSYACSGATIDQGIVGPYGGVESAKEARDRLAFYGGQGDRIPHFRGISLPEQIDSAAELLCRVEGQKPCLSAAAPDILTISTGGNELGFGAKVAGCATGRCVFTRAEMAPLLARLRERYGALADRIAALGARHVLAMTYPYLTRRADGRTYCGDSPFNFERSFVPRLSTFFGFGISRAEGRNAEKVVLEPLNALISEEASRRGWTVVDGYRRDRGICVRPGWFLTVGDSDVKQGRIGETREPLDFVGLLPSGAMHPNVFGHAGIRARLHPEIDRLLPP